ncbi:hypothetical protein ScPMuIL_000281 [Solemya velum]
MQFTPSQLKDKLLKCLDVENNVVDMAGCLEVLSILEGYPITREGLEQTRIGKHVNELRKKTEDDQLAKRAKKLVRSWQKLISTPSDKPLVNGEQSKTSPAISQPISRIKSKPNSPAVVGRHVESPTVSKSSLLASREKPITPKLQPGQINSKPNTPSLPPSHIHQKRLFSPKEHVSSPRLPSVSPGLSRNNSHKSINSPKLTSRPSTPVCVTNRSGISSPSLASSRPHTPVSFDGGGGSRPHTPICNNNTATPDIVNRLSPESLTKVSLNSKSYGERVEHSSVSSNKKIVSKSDQKNSSKSRKRPPEEPSVTVIPSKLRTGKDCRDEVHVVNGSVCSTGRVKDKYSERKRNKTKNTNSLDASSFSAKKNASLNLKTDFDREKLPAVVSKTPKVKTTAQLIAELQAKSGSNAVGKTVIHQIETNQIVKEVDAPLSVVPPGAKPRSRKKQNDESPENLRPPSTPLSWSQTKNDLVQKYLQSSVTAPSPEDVSPFKDENCRTRFDSSTFDVQDSGVDVGDSAAADFSTQCTSDSTEHKSHAGDKKEAKLPSLADIYSLLPPLDLDTFELDDGTYEVPQPIEVTDSVVKRVLTDNWVGVNGSSDNNRTWHDWTDTYSIDAYDGGQIHILPYVVID